MNFVESLSMFYTDVKEIPCVTGEGAPTSKTEGAPGVLYMDMENGTLYKCRGADYVNETFTWEEIGGDGTRGENGGYYIPAVTQTDTAAMTVAFTASNSEMPAVAEMQITLPEGPPGEMGAAGPAGTPGADGKDGEDYVLTEADKAEIAKQVENATIVQAPKYVETVEEMTDTDRPYVLASTGHIWAYMDTTTEQEVTKTDTITATDDNAYMDGYRLGNGVDSYSNDAAGYHITPIIDLTKSEYSGKTIQLHLEGGQYSSTGAIATWIQCRPYGTDLTQLSNRPYTVDTAVTGSVMTELSGFTVVHNSDTSTTITINVLPVYGSGKVPVGYMRFCGKGAVADSSIYITYPDTETVTGGQWVDTGTTYAPTLTDAEKAEIAEQAAALIDTQMLALIGDGTVTV